MTTCPIQYFYCLGEARACEERARNAMMDAARLAGGQNNSQICAKKLQTVQEYYWDAVVEPVFIAQLSELNWLHCKDTIPKFEANIPRKGTALLQSQFLHSCFCEQFIYFSDRSAYSAAGMWKLGLRPHNSFSGKEKPITSTLASNFDSFFIIHNFLGFTTRDVKQKGKLLSFMSFRQIIIKIWALFILHANFRSIIFQSKKKVSKLEALTLTSTHF